MEKDSLELFATSFSKELNIRNRGVVEVEVHQLIGGILLTKQDAFYTYEYPTEAEAWTLAPKPSYPPSILASTLNCLL
jgi:hypothetical protein